MTARDDLPTRRDVVAAIAATAFAAPGIGCAQTAPATLTTRQFGARHDDRADDTAALNAAMAALRRQGGGTLVWSAGIARTQRPIAVPNNVRIRAEDPTSGVRSTYRGPVDNLKSPLLLGNWHPAFLGRRRARAAAGTPWADQKVDFHPVRGRVRSDQRQLGLERPFAPGRFVAGEVYALITQEMTPQGDTGVQLRIPNDQSLLRVAAADPAAGTVSFDQPIGFDSPGAVYLVRIRDGAVDDFGQPVYILRDAVIDGLRVFGFNAFGNNCMGIYNCRLSNFSGDVVTPIQANAVTRSVIDGFRGTFSGDRLVEVKFGHHDGIIRNLQVTNSGPGSGRAAMFSVGEYCRDLLIERFAVQAPRWNAGHLFQIQPGRRCVFSQGSVHAPSAAIDPVYFFADEARSLEASGLRDVEVTHGSAAHIVFAGGRHEPRDCFVQRSRFRTTSTREPILAAVFLGGQDNEVADNVFDRGRFRFTGARATGNRVFGNTTDRLLTDGAYEERNEIGRNLAR